jgi:hypothetical protein
MPGASFLPSDAVKNICPVNGISNDPVQPTADYFPE